MTLNTINAYLKSVLELINQTVSLAIKLMIIGLVFVIEQWVEQYY